MFKIFRVINLRQKKITLYMIVEIDVEILEVLEFRWQNIEKWWENICNIVVYNCVKSSAKESTLVYICCKFTFSEKNIQRSISVDVISF